MLLIIGCIAYGINEFLKRLVRARRPTVGYLFLDCNRPVNPVDLALSVLSTHRGQWVRCRPSLIHARWWRWWCTWRCPCAPPRDRWSSTRTRHWRPSCSRRATTKYNAHTRLTALCPGLPGWAGTRKVKPEWILLKQETVSGSGISCIILQKSAPRSRQITTPAPHHSVFYRPDAIPAAQASQSNEGQKVLQGTKQ